MRNRFKEFNNKKWATYTLISVIGMLTAFIIAAIGFKQIPVFVDFAGVFQRLSIIFGFVWLTTLSRLIIKTE
jgi:Na+/H+-dicarboxylate symporter